MASYQDGPASPRFRSLTFHGNVAWAKLAGAGLSPEMAAAMPHAPRGACVLHGMPLAFGSRVVVAREGAKPTTVKLGAVTARWLVFAHTSDHRPLPYNEHGFISPTTGEGHLGEPAANYVVIYADGAEEPVLLRRRYEIGTYSRRWGENCTVALGHAKAHAFRGAQEQPGPGWGWSQTRATANDWAGWIWWLYAWENPRPRKAIRALRIEPGAGLIVLGGLAVGDVQSNPLRWRTRRKAVLTLPPGVKFDPTLDAEGNLARLRLDLGAVISATPQPVYPNATWAETYNNAIPTVAPRGILVEYAAHEDACFHLPGGKTVPVARLEAKGQAGALQVVAPATQLVKVRITEQATGQPVAVKFHAHGEAGEYLPPVDRHRLPNSAWFEDYSPEFQHWGRHCCVYVPGETVVRLPLGRVYVEISKGFEVRPVRQLARVTRATKELVFTLDRVLPWRERGWVSADTHVHFLSPHTGLLEGAGEGVNVVNLLASQWGELMTNSGDFDGATTLGSREAGGDGEYLLRVGTENRQHILGHISLVGYNGPLIAPMTSGGADESAIGDAVEVLLTEWARQCRAQGGVVVVPHFPNPRLEHAAAIVDGSIDAIEMSSWGNLYGGIDPYSLSDWYRYLNNGYMLAAVGGTDKMSATTAVGTVRSYAQLQPNEEFTYETWKAAIRRAATFVTYGPLLEFSVDGHGMGQRFAMSGAGGTVDVTWRAASVTVPMTKVELVVNGVIVAGTTVDAEDAAGHFTVKLERSSWLALLVRGHYADQPEIVAAHSSPVMVEVAGTPFYQAADSLTILEQIEGALAYLDTLGTRAEDAVYKRMRLVLTGVHRKLHNRMHQHGKFHDHTAGHDHAAHHR